MTVKRVLSSEHVKVKMSAPKVLIYQLTLPDGIAEYLEYRGFLVTVATNDNVVGLISKAHFDIYIIDYYKELKPRNLQLLRLIKEHNEKAPVIILSSLDTPEYIINALNNGADNYITKPFNMDLLVAYSHAALRSSRFKDQIFIKNFEIGPDYKYISTTGELFYKGKLHRQLTGQHQKLLAILCGYMDEIAPLDVILRALWKTTSRTTVQSLRCLISNLRNALSEDPNISITTIINTGYILEIINKRSE